MFNESKATALAAFFLSQEKNKTMPYLKLIKLMYLADREHLDKHDASITGDTYVCMKHGPVLSMTYMLIKQNAEKNRGKDTTWDEYISTKKYNVVLSKNFNELSKTETQSAQEISSKHGDKDQWALVRYTHEHCTEWENPLPHAVRELPLSRLLNVLNKDFDTITDIMLQEIPLTQS